MAFVSMGALERRVLFSQFVLDFDGYSQTVDLPTNDAAPSVATELSTLAVPGYSSLPGASNTFYLDFDGDSAKPTMLTPTSAFDITGDAANFDDAELVTIHKVWEQISEIFSPFNVNVTTVNPGLVPSTPTETLIIGGNGAWTGSSDVFGAAPQLGFPGSTAYVFSDQIRDDYYDLPDFGSIIGVAGAHQLGHTLGLNHQSQYNAAGAKINEYHPGTADLNYIMGHGTIGVRPHWWNGTSALGSGVLQDDMAVILAKLGARPDDAPSTPAGAVSLGNVSTTTTLKDGVISSTSDVDVYSFTIPTAGAFTARMLGSRMSEGERDQMLNSVLEVRAASGGLLVAAVATQDSPLDREVTATLNPGTYYLYARSAGGYGDVGQYRLALGRSVDAIAPTVSDISYSGDQQTIVVKFSENVAGSVGTDDIVIAGDEGRYVPVSAEYDTTTFTAQYRFRGRIGSGSHFAFLDPGAVKDQSENVFNTTAGTFVDVLNGDANGDWIVDVADLGILASNWQQSPRTLAQGDFNFDGKVDVADLGILATNWQKSVSSPTTGLKPGAPKSLSVLGQSPKRVIDLLDA